MWFEIDKNQGYKPQSLTECKQLWTLFLMVENGLYL